SPTPEEYHGRSRNTRRPPPPRVRTRLRPRLLVWSVQPNVGTTQATLGGAGRAVLGRSRTFGALAFVTGGATMATSTGLPSGMALPVARAIEPACVSTTKSGPSR